MDNKKTKTAGYGLITTGLLMATFRLAEAFGWIALTPEQKASLVEFVIEVAPIAGLGLAGLGFLGLGHKGEKQQAVTEQLVEKVEEVKTITETAAGIQVAKDAVQSAVSDAIGNATQH